MVIHTTDTDEASATVASRKSNSGSPDAEQ